MKKEDLIKRVIITREESKEDELYGFIVIRRNSIEKYGYGELTKEELNKKYSAIIMELKDQLKNKLEGLGLQEAVNKLFKLKLIQDSSEEFITGITFYQEEDEEKPSKYEIQYPYESRVVEPSGFYDEDDFLDSLENQVVKMCKSYGFEINDKEDLTEEFLGKLVKLGLLKEEGLLKDNEESFDDEDVVLPSKKSKKKKSSSKVKNLKVNWPLVGAVIGVLAITGLGLHSCSKSNESAGEDFGPIKTPELTVMPIIEDEEIDFFADDRVEEIDEIECMPTVNPLVFSKPIYIDGEERVFTYYEEPESEELLMRDIDGTMHYDTSYEIMYEIRNQEMESIGNQTQSGYELENTGHYIFFENLFNEYSLTDKAYVKYFSMMGNEIIRNAYLNQNAKSVQDYAQISGLEVISLINNDAPLHVYIYGEEYYIRFSELSRDAKEMVLNIAWMNLFPLNSYREAYKTDEQLELWEEDTIPEIYCDGQWYTKANVGDIIISKYNELSMTR